MQISLRSQMVAGTAAFVGAGALALTPVAPAVGIPALSQAKAEVTLAAFANPINALIGTVGVAGSYLLNGGMAFNPPTAGAGAINWPSAGISDVMNAYLQFEGLGGYTAVGILPQIVDDSFPIATALVTNGLDYIWNTVKAVGTAATAVGDIAWTIPTTAVSVALDLIALNLPQAIADISAAATSILGDITTAGTALLGAGTYVLTGVVTRATEVLAQLIAEVPLTVVETVRQISQVATSVIDTGQAIISGLTSLDPEAVWNAAVLGLLSPAGIPGTILNVTLGAGVQVGPVTTQESVAENFVFSTRTVIQGAVKAIAGAINTPNPAPPAAAVSPAAARAAASAPASAVEAAPVTGSDSASAATVRSAAAEVDARAATVDAPDATATSDDTGAPAATPTKSKAAAHAASRGSR